MIFSTGIIGAEQFVRSIGIVVGGYPNEVELMDRMNQGLELKFQWSYVAYGIFIAITAGLGIFNQYRLKKLKDDFIKGSEYLKALVQANGENN